MFAISRCPHCRRLHGLQVPIETTMCRICGKRYGPSKGTIVKSFESDIEMRRYLQGIKSIEGASDDPMAEIDMVEKPKRSSGPRRGKGRAIKMVLEAIRTGPRSLDEILQLANESIEARTLEEGLTSLMEEGIVYRTKDAMYALVI